MKLKRRRQQQQRWWQTCCKMSQYWTSAVLRCSIWVFTKFQRADAWFFISDLKKKKKLLQSKMFPPFDVFRSDSTHSTQLGVFTVAVYRPLTTTQRSVTPCSLSLSVLVHFQLREALPLPSHGFIPVVMVTRCSLTDLNTPNWGLYHDKMYRNASRTARGACWQFQRWLLLLVLLPR